MVEGTRQYPPGRRRVTSDPNRPRLRQLREERGWTQQDVADQLIRLAWLHNRERVGVNADMVAKWERGAKGVSTRYRDLMCLLFGVDADYLRVKTTGSKPRTSPTAAPDEGSL